MTSAPASPWPVNPVLVELWRGEGLESVHRGAWAVVDADGEVVRGAGDLDHATPSRSAVKCLQALPLLESGAAEAAGYDGADLALALSSHNAEADHTERVAAILARLGLDATALLCGAQEPGDPAARAALRDAGQAPSALHNNCSGKHAGFLATARQLGQDPATYLDPEGAVQRAVHAAVVELCGLQGPVPFAIDGCSAPTWRLSVRELATAFARVGTPEGLGADRAAACRRMTAAAAAHPTLIAGRHKRLCTALVEASGGALFPKIGAEGVYAIARVGSGEALALKMDDGGGRGLHAAVLGLLGELGWLGEQALAELAQRFGPPTRNWAGLEVANWRVPMPGGRG